MPSITAMNDAAAVSPSTQRCGVENPCSFMDASLNYGPSGPQYDKKILSEGLHYRCEGLLSCICFDIGAAQNLQPIEICDEKGRQHARIGIRGELSGFLSPHDRVSVGFLE